MSTPDFSTNKIYDQVIPYKIGQTIELMLEIDTDAADTVGDTISINISDVFGNLISTISADRIPSSGIYTIEYKIPALAEVYNSAEADESEYDDDYYYLKDTWVFPDTSEVSFEFQVERELEQIVTNNSLFVISITGLISGTNTLLPEEEIKFTSTLDNYPVSVEDVVSVNETTLEKVDVIKVAKEIQDKYKYVLYNMKPNVIYRQAPFDDAVKGFVKYSTAMTFLKESLSVTSESKQIDTVQISKSYNTDIVFNEIEDMIRKYALIIWAGGMNTPFITQKFQKGLYDPNRPKYARANLDIQGPTPYVNTTTQNILITDDSGDVIELRGIRTINVPTADRFLL